nr:hypothetical protein [Tanacetum cinerariifolium]
MSLSHVLDDLDVKANSTALCNQMLVKIDEETQRDLHVLHDLLDTLNVMQAGCNGREALMQGLEQQKFKLGPYKSLEFFKELKMKDAIRMLELKQVISDLQLSIHNKWEFIQEIMLTADSRKARMLMRMVRETHNQILDKIEFVVRRREM